MFDRLGRLAARYPRRIVLAWFLLTAFLFTLTMTGFGGQGLFERLHSGEPTVPGSESTKARELLDEHSPSGEEISLIVLGLDLDNPDGVAEAGRAAATLNSQLLTVDGVDGVLSPFVFPGGLSDPRAAALTSADADGFLLTVTLQLGLDPEVHDAAVAEVTDLLRDFPGRVSPVASGIVASSDLMTEAVISQMERDLITGELVALPVSLLIMVVVFGGFLAAGMPLAGALASIAGGLGALLAFSHVIELDSVVVNVVTILGLGLSIDYGLLVVSRFREELLHAHSAELSAAAAATDAVPARRRRRRSTGGDDVVRTAVRATLRTAGRTVSYSALIVAISILGLLLLRPDILRSLGAAGVAVVLIALLTAITLVPALLVLMGRRMLKPPLLRRIPGLRRIVAGLGDVPPADGMFSRLAGRVQRRPWLVLVLVSMLLMLAASPLMNLQLRNSTTELLPSDSDQRDFLTIVNEDYPLAAAPTMGVLVEGTEAGANGLGDRITDVPEVLGIDPGQQVGADYVLLGVRVDTDDPGGSLATDVVEQIRQLRETDPSLPTFWVYGEGANQVDFTRALLDGLPYAAAVVVLAVFILLFLMTGSLLIPAKALVVNLLSLAASLGVTTWIFAEGQLEGLLNFTSVGGLESYVVAVAVAFGFGLAMDYEVFLLARIKEIYDATGDNDHAVKYGLQRSGRIITSAALVIIVVFLGFVAGDLLAIKQAGVALAVTVFIDATLVRMLLVPASMTLLGHYNWWAPRPMRALYARFGITH
ncbi:MMPL family transporter [Pseudactinotalea sp. Z1748]|uniref:MMPL family transporter n=1 Tax=Pseudactinotalea sp. Z1748 TaxID=3413027 RepID=UPI003C7BC09B